MEAIDKVRDSEPCRRGRGKGVVSGGPTRVTEVQVDGSSPAVRDSTVRDSTAPSSDPGTPAETYGSPWTQPDSKAQSISKDRCSERPSVSPEITFSYGNWRTSKTRVPFEA